MSEASTIRKNSFFALSSISIRLVANILLFMLIARFYGAKIFGQFTFAHTLATIFILFADFGFDVLLTTEIAKNRKDTPSLFQTFFSLKFLFCIAALVGMWVVALTRDVSYSSRILVLIFSFFAIFTALNNFLFALFKGYEQLHFETKISFIVNVSLLVILVVLSVFKISIYIIAIAFVATRILGLVLSMRTVFKIVPEVTFKLQFGNWSKVRSQVFVFGMQLLFGNLFFQLDTLLLSFWRNDVEVGIYQAVFKLIALPLVIPDVLISALLPVLSRLHVENRDYWQKIGYLMNKTLILVSLPISLILFVFAEPIIKTVYGKSDFYAAIPVLKIFAIIVFIRFFVETYALLLTTSDNQKKRMIVVISGTLLNLIINYYLIRSDGIMGAAITSLITNLLVGFGYIFFCFRLLTVNFINLRVLVPIVISFLLALLFSNYSFISFWIEAPLLFILMSVSLYLFAFSNEERNLLVAEQKIISLVMKNKMD
jgi:O-antigen/teichoic acid export membrane protein